MFTGENPFEYEFLNETTLKIEGKKTNVEQKL